MRKTLFLAGFFSVLLLDGIAEDYTPATWEMCIQSFEDVDGDDVPDSLEAYLAQSGQTLPTDYDPKTSDHDNDGFSDHTEWVLGTDPLDATVGFSTQSFPAPEGGGVGMRMTLPEYFGNYAEVFGRANLRYGNWEIVDGWIPTYGSGELTVEDIVASNENVYFYQIFDATIDYDGDGFSDWREHYITRTDGETFNYLDEDNDGMHDWYELKLFGDLDEDGSGDFDGDLLLNNQEMVYSSNTSSIVWNSDPSLADTDGDGMDDYQETVTYTFLNPLDRTDLDVDFDGISNLVEIALGTSITNWDSDGDTLSDRMEMEWFADPLSPDDLGSDLDGDGLALSNEYTYGTNPFIKDTDGDTTWDGAEVSQNSSPTDASDEGLAPSEDDLVAIELYVSQSGSISYSELYQLSIHGERTIRLQNKDFGSNGKLDAFVRKGESYSVTLEHIATSSDHIEKYSLPDYDYWASIDEQFGESPNLIFENTEEVLTDYHTSTHTTVGPLSNSRKLTGTMHVPQITLNLSQTGMTLKHDYLCDMNIVVQPPGMPLFDYEIETAFTDSGGWCDLSTKQSMTWTNRVAGNFKLRAKARFKEEFRTYTLKSPEVSAKVQFPEIGEIVSDSGVVSAMDQAWNMSETWADSHGFYEFGFMIYLNTSNNEYEIDSITPSTKFSWDDEDTAVAVLEEKWSSPENPLPNASGVTYSVACFHTHPPLTDAPDYVWRIAGPSLEDLTLHFSVDTPGVVRDYIGVDHVVLPGHSKDDPDKLYHPLGPFRRGL